MQILLRVPRSRSWSLEFFLNPESNTDTNDKFITVKFRGLAAMEKPDFIACPS